MNLTPFVIVEHTTDKPAEDTLVAAQLFQALNSLSASNSRICFARIREIESEYSQIGERDHVTDYGSLVSNGLLWIERAIGESFNPLIDEVVPSDVCVNTPQIICLNYRLFRKWSINQLHEFLEIRAPGALWIRVRADNVGFRCYLAQDVLSAGIEIGTVTQNAFLHPKADFPIDKIVHILRHMGIEPTESARDHENVFLNKQKMHKILPCPRIVVIGEEHHFRCVYPAVLTSLGDSAVDLGIKPSLEFLSAEDVILSKGQRRLETADGILLPGGSDMTQPKGQIQAAIVAIDKKIPVMGQCLGMQSLVVAVARHCANMGEANLEETHPDAPILAFKRMSDADGKTIHRLGLHKSIIEYRSLLHRIYKSEVITQKMHHRYQLNPDIIPILEKIGLKISARSLDRKIVDGVEFSEHPFLIGLEGHPELSSRPNAPNPAISEFVRHTLLLKKTH